jgi:hypothetical protein
MAQTTPSVRFECRWSRDQTGRSMSVDPSPSVGVDGHLRFRELEPEDGEEGGGTEESEDEDEEPFLKYEKIGGALPDLLQKDSASALAVSNGFIVS